MVSRRPTAATQLHSAQLRLEAVEVDRGEMAELFPEVGTEVQAVARMVALVHLVLALLVRRDRATMVVQREAQSRPVEVVEQAPLVGMEAVQLPVTVASVPSLRSRALLRTTQVVVEAEETLSPVPQDQVVPVAEEMVP
jgi:hypothetical protein